MFSQISSKDSFYRAQRCSGGDRKAMQMTYMGRLSLVESETVDKVKTPINGMFFIFLHVTVAGPQANS